jgi:hypothetical protein
MPVGHFQASAETIATPTFVVGRRLKIALAAIGAAAVIISVLLGLPKMGFGNAGIASNGDVAMVTQPAKPADVPIAVGRDAWTAIEEFRAIDFTVNPTDLQREHIYGYDSELKTKLAGNYVCYQNLIPGTPLGLNQEILFTIGPDCKDKRTTMLAGSIAKAAGLWAPVDTGVPDALDNYTLDGWVIDVGDEYHPEQITLLTLYGEVALDLAKIEPLDSWCISENTSDDALISAAIASRDDLLQLESPVRVVFAGGKQKAEGFIHRLTSSGQLLDGDAPANSVNEQLIKAGTWLPDDLYIEETNATVAPVKRIWKLSSFASDSALEELDYLNLLVAAANAQKKTPTNRMIDCMGAAQNYWLTVELPYLKSSTNSSVGGGASGGVNVGRCWVNPYLRNGHWVRGYYRNC